MSELNLSEMRTFADAERLLDFVASARKLTLTVEGQNAGEAV